MLVIGPELSSCSCLLSLSSRCLLHVFLMLIEKGSRHCSGLEIDSVVQHGDNTNLVCQGGLMMIRATFQLRSH